MMPTRSLGATGPTVSAVALGCMGMSGMYGAADEATSIATIHAAIDAGITLLDTGDFYGMGHNERLVGRAIAGRRDAVQLSVKFGALRGPDHSWLGVDGRPAAVKAALAYTLHAWGGLVVRVPGAFFKRRRIMAARRISSATMQALLARGAQHE